MNLCYIDTNIFIYTSDPSSPYYKDCLSLFEAAADKKIFITTSTESIQEIMHVHSRLKEIDKGFALTDAVFMQIPDILAIDLPIIKTLIGLFKKYKTAQSRDLLHVATCVENKIRYLITIDRGFDTFSEIKAMTPAQFLNLI